MRWFPSLPVQQCSGCAQWVGLKHPWAISARGRRLRAARLPQAGCQRGPYRVTQVNSGLPVAFHISTVCHSLHPPSTARPHNTGQPPVPLQRQVQLCSSSVLPPC